MQLYDEMVDSGVDWIGLIPKGWAIEKVKRVFLKKNEKAISEDPVILSLARVGVKVRDISSNEGQLAASYDNYNPVEPGDILLNPMDLQSGANCSISKVEGVISPAYVNLRPIGGNNSQFFDYYFKLQYWSRAFFVNGRGISYDNRWTLGNETLMNYPVVVPAPEQQQKIADFLDKETAKIDNLIAKQENLLKLLEEKRRATITHAVTRGLTSGIELKETGIPWLGSVPKHWVLIRLKYVGESIIGLTYSPNDLSEEGTMVLRSMNIAGGKINTETQIFVSKLIPEKLLTKANDLLICSRNGSRRLIGKCGLIQKSQEGHTFGVFNTVYRSKYSKYIYYVLNSNIFYAQLGLFMTSTINQLTVNTLNNFEVALPPEDEQIEIVNHLNKFEEELNLLVDKIDRQINLLKERRTSLISHTITGKIKV